jgi:hypothetical protein
VWSLSFVFDEDAFVGVVVDFDLAMASASSGSEAGKSGVGGSDQGAWRKLRAREEQDLHQQRQQLTLSGHGTNETEGSLSNSADSEHESCLSGNMASQRNLSCSRLPEKTHTHTHTYRP